MIDNSNAISHATIYIRVEDASRADAPSKLISEKILRNARFSFNLGRYVLPFSISVPIGEESKMCSLNVHVDTNGNGKTDKGDYINMENYPVFLKGFQKKVVVKAKQIK